MVGMIGLPEPVSSLGKYQVSVTQYKGMNYRAAPQDGELIAAKNISSRNYPFLSERQKRSKVEPYKAPEQIFSWEKLVVVDGSSLYYGEDVVATLTNSEKKQFAVVGNNLIVWPDKIMVNLQDKKVTQMDVKITSLYAVNFSGNSIQMDERPEISEIKKGKFGARGVGIPYIRVYESLKFQSGQWVKTGQKDVRLGNEMVGKYFIPYKTETGEYSPNVNWNEDKLSNVPEGVYKYEDNKDGVYCKITELTLDEWEANLNGYYGDWEFNYETFKADVTQSKWSDFIRVGDAVTISGCTTYPDNNKKHLLITAIDDETNKLTFVDGTFTGSGDSWTDGPITVQRDIPDLDFICEKNNRLWGVSNAAAGEVYNAQTGKYDEVTSRVVMASALGDPLNFWTFAGVDTDSYQVAVASKDDFTALISYGEAVMAMKEYSVYKIYGDYPSNYQMIRDDIEGVAQGCEKSAVIIADVLYYVGPSGVYANSGAGVSLLSFNLGDVPMENAAAGMDGPRYVLSAERDGVRKKWVYDTRLGVWSEEGESTDVEYATVSGLLYSVGGGAVQVLDDDSTEDVQWMAELAPTDEGTVRRKRYKWLQGRVTLEPGAQISVYYAADGQDYKLGKTIDEEGMQTFRIPLAPMRTDKLKIKVEGHGGFRLDAMERAFYVGSEVK